MNILDMQAKAEDRAYRSDRRMDRLETSIAQTIRVVKLMVRAGRPLRSDVRELQHWRGEMEHWQAKSEQYRAQTEQNLAEITGKLDALIDVVDRWNPRNGGKKS
jgi:hypothetical protein